MLVFLCLARFRLRNDLYCVEWGVKLYSLTHSCTFFADSPNSDDANGDHSSK